MAVSIVRCDSCFRQIDTDHDWEAFVGDTLPTDTPNYPQWLCPACRDDCDELQECYEEKDQGPVAAVEQMEAKL